MRRKAARVTLLFMQLIEGCEAARAALEKANAARALTSNPEVEAVVRELCEAVRLRGDEALLEIERKFDCASLELSNLRVTQHEIDEAWTILPAHAQKALQRAADNIEAFHRVQPTGDWFTTSPDGAF